MSGATAMNQRLRRAFSSVRSWGALRISGLYLLAGGLWILFSDRLVAVAVRDPDVRTLLGVLKGWAYIAVTALLLYLMISRHVARLLEREQGARRTAELLHAAGESFGRALTPEAIMEALLDKMNQLVPYASANVLLRESDAKLRVRHVRGYAGWSGAEQAHSISFEVASTSHIGDIIATQRSLLVGDTLEFAGWRVLPGTEHVRCWLGVPLVAGHEVMGICSIDRCVPHSLGPDDVRLAETLVASAATAIARVQLVNQLQQELAERARAEQALIEERALLAGRVEERTADLRQANAQLARAARLKDEFLAGMSHELRTPLNAILGRSEVLGEQIYGPLTERQLAALHSIEESGRHLLALINDILDLSKIEAGKITLEQEDVAVDTICHSSMRMVAQTALAKRIALSTTIDTAIVTVHADGRRLRQILVNLLANAVKFTPNGGRVGLEVRGDPEGQAVLFTVWDTGIGIAVEDFPRLFQPFTQLDSKLSRQYEGTGLGLALVRQLAEAHGGAATVTSTLGEGSRFTVSLPWAARPAAAAPADHPPAADQAPASQPDRAARPLILLAEDHAENRDMLLDYLNSKGYQVAAARNGAEALARAHECPPALILMDVQMPDIDGLEATRRIRADAALRDTPVIVLTALAMPGDRERCLQAGADDYLTKPISLRALLAAIEAQLQGR
jgi:signal transduction histidine kinase/ActR/RegA family two-component response regulator